MSEPTTRQVACPILVLRLVQPQLSGDEQAEAVRDELLAQLHASKAENVVLDLSSIKYMSSSGITPLLTLVKAVRGNEGRLVLVGLTPPVEGVLTASRLITSSKTLPAPFEHQPDVPAAIHALLMSSQ
ncbi:MAG: STAS domain-containing protein, partial [Gemmataceae bacterium]